MSSPPPAVGSNVGTQPTKRPPYKIGKLTKYFLGLSFMAVFTNITILICNYLNIPQTDYLLYLLWMYVIVMFFAILPKQVNIEDYY